MLAFWRKLPVYIRAMLILTGIGLQAVVFHFGLHAVDPIFAPSWPQSVILPVMFELAVVVTTAIAFSRIGTEAHSNPHSLMRHSFGVPTPDQHTPPPVTEAWDGKAQDLDDAARRMMGKT